MEYASENIQQPDQSRPAKRVRLDAPLHVTEKIQEEMEIVDDGDDWNDIYGDPIQPQPETPSKVNKRNDADNFRSGAQLSSQLDHDVSSSTDPSSATLEATSSGLFNLAPVGERAETLRNAGHAEQTRLANAEGVPVNAIDSGPDLIDEQHHATAVTDEPDVRMVEDLSAVNEYENPVLDGLENAINQDQRFVQPPSQELSLEPRTRATDIDMSNATTEKKVTNDQEFMNAAAAQKENKTAEWQFDSSDAESSSDSDSDSESDSEDSDNDSEGGYEMLDPATAAKMLMQGDGEDEDGDKGKKSNGDRQPRTANEIKETIIPKPDVIVTDDMKVTELGIVERAVENMLLIKGSTPGEYQVLESGSVLCNEKREVVGAVLETLGRVQAPMYSVQFTNAQEIENAGLQHGVKIYYVDSHSTFVFTQPLKNLKGTDASNIHDEEVGEEEMEFSDDEAEAEYKRQKKQAKKAGRGGLNTQTGRGGSRSFNTFGHDVGTSFVNASDAPRQDYGGGMSYDDEPTEDFYSPLKRPDNLGDMMAGGDSQQNRAQPANFDRGRGRGRGDRGRGRGDRGRGRNDRGRGRGGFDNARGGDRGRGRGNSDGQRGNDRGRGNGGPQNSHRGNAQSFPDRHNNEFKPALIPHGLPPKPEIAHYSPAAVPQQSTQVNQHHQLTPSTYQFNGYTFQHGIQPSHLPHQHPYSPQQQQQQQQQPPAPAAHFAAGSYVNPAYYQAQHLAPQAQWAAQHGQFATPPIQAPASAPYPPLTGQQMYAQGGPAAGAYGAVPPQQQQSNLADVLRRLNAQR